MGIVVVCIESLFNAFSVGSAPLIPRVLPWAKLENAFGVKRSSFDTDSSLGMTI